MLKNKDSDIYIDTDVDTESNNNTDDGGYDEDESSSSSEEEEEIAEFEKRLLEE